MFFSEINMNQSQAFKVEIRNSSLHDFEVIYNGNPNNGTGRYWIEIYPPRLLQYLRIAHKHDIIDVMTICEVLVYDLGNACIHI